MPVISSVATAVPPYQVSQHVARDFARTFFESEIKDVDRYLTVYDNAEIDTRYLSAPPEWFMQPHTFGEANDLFIDVACQLGETATRRALDRASHPPTSIISFLCRPPALPPRRSTPA